MKRKLLLSGLAGVVCLAYYLMLVFFHIGVPCVFHEITGLLCPGCGVTHMILYMLVLDFQSALESNQLLFVIQPLIYYFIIKYYICWLLGRKNTLSLFENIIVYILIGCCVVFFIWRNFKLLF